MIGLCLDRVALLLLCFFEMPSSWIEVFYIILKVFGFVIALDHTGF